MKMLAEKNMALNVPKTSTAERFAARIVFSRKIRSGIIGCLTRASITPKAASATATPARLPMVRAVPSPRGRPRRG
jgi:hypothetical protein